VAVDELQQIVDGLAARLGRSVAVDDPMLKLLAASRHFGDEDPFRVRVVLNRESDEAGVRYLLAQGVAGWQGPGRVAANNELGIQPRVCVPVRVHGLLLGFVWLIDADGSLSEEEIGEVVAAAEEAGLVLYRRRLLHERERAREEALLRDLVSADPAARTRAREELLEERLLGESRYVALASVEVVVDAAPGDFGRIEVSVRDAVEHAVAVEPARSTLALAQGRRGLLLRSAARPPNEPLRGLAERTVSRLRGQLGRGGRCVAGLGSSQRVLEGAGTSHEQARAAARAAALLPALGDVVAWDALGVYALLIKLAPEQLTPTVYPPPVLALVEHDDSGTLLGTVETYLDCAGDSRRAAEALHIHRTTLYYRLERAEQLTGLSLRDGRDRLTLHLGVKLARLAGAYQQQPPAS
jgi:sugar diacid utilization regulator